MQMQKVTNMDEDKFLGEGELKALLEQCPAGYLEPSNSFFEEGNKTIPEFRREGVITVSDEEELHIQSPVACNIFGCKETFSTVFAYQSHYNTQHRYICSECKKTLPTPHLLDLHLTEKHDSFFAVQSQRKPMFACFLEECSHKDTTPEERKDHCIRIHKFPSNYRFDCTPSHKGAPSANSSKTEKVETNNNMSEPVPFTKKNINFTFGHNRSNKVFSNKSYAKTLAKHSTAKVERMETNALENKQTFFDLMESLPS